ncbi:MAG: YjbF family lipoprotein [Rhodobacteraceae bacterium]|nr:YjbF family lipoprotein [Paracoccaceae bacterium]
MGEVLALRGFSVFIGAFAALAIAGCSSDKNKTPLQDTLIGAIRSIGKKPDTQANRRAVEALTREELTGVGTNPTILVDVEAADAYASLFQISLNGQHDIFMTADRITMTFSKGLLTATRGIGADLYTADISQTRAAIQGGASGVVATTRVHKSLSGDNQVIATRYECSLADQGIERIVSIHKAFRLRRYVETCRFEGDEVFANTYWVDPATRVMWKSRQWVSPLAGYFGIDVLIPGKS